jgi:hypothetical protein
MCLACPAEAQEPVDSAALGGKQLSWCWARAHMILKDHRLVSFA